MTILLFWLLTQSAFATTTPCEAKLIPISSMRLSQSISAEATLEFLTPIPFEFGGELSRIKKVGSSWYSGALTDGNDIQSDPRFFALIFGNKAGYFFGFRQLEDDVVTAPDAEALNKTIEILNEVELKDDPIKVRFYNSDTLVEGWDHLKKFAKLEIPIAKKKSHDVAVHAATMGLETKDLEFLAEQIQWQIDFLEWAEPRFSKTSWFEPLKKTLVTLLVSYKSDLSGDIPHNVGLRLMMQMTAADPELNGDSEEVAMVFNEGMSAPELLKHLAQDTLAELKTTGFRFEPNSKVILRQALDEFIRTHAPAVHGSRPDLASDRAHVNVLYSRIAKRRGKIAEAVVKAKKRLNLPK